MEEERIRKKKEEGSVNFNAYIFMLLKKIVIEYVLEYVYALISWH